MNYLETLQYFVNQPVAQDIGGSLTNQFDGVYCGIAQGKEVSFVFVFQDRSYKAGSVGVKHASQIVLAIETAIQKKMPLLMNLYTGGARLQEGMYAGAGAINCLQAIAKASGCIPIISIVEGVNAGVGSYLVALSDVAIFVEDVSEVFLTGPKVIEAVLGRKFDRKELGSTKVHNEKTGLCSHVVPTLDAGYQLAARLIRFLAKCNKEIDIAEVKDVVDFENIIPKEAHQGYDMHRVINKIVDIDSVIECYAGFARNLLTVFAEINGVPIAIIANQPKVMSGALDVKSCKKFARFLQICDAHQIPILFLADCPGIMPGIEQEHLGLIPYSGKVAQILTHCTTIRITVVLRRLIGGSNPIMNSKAIGADTFLAWNNAFISIMGEKASENLLKNDSQQNLTLKDLKKAGIIDDIIQPEHTKIAIVNALIKHQNKSKAPFNNKIRTINPM